MTCRRTLKTHPWQVSFWPVLCAAALLVTPTNAQDACGALSDVLKYGVNETQVASTREGARSVYRLACNEESKKAVGQRRAEITASYKLFSGAARNNHSSLEEYQRKHCSLNEDDVTSLVARSFRQRSVNPAAVAAWSQCRRQVTGVRLEPKLDPQQTVASFSMTSDPRFATTLRGINSETFKCMVAGTGREIAVGGDPISLSPEVALVVRCNRQSESEQIGGREVTVYRADSLILDLSTGAHRIDFVARREGSAAEEFAELQNQIRKLQTKRVPSGMVAPFELAECPNGWTDFERAAGRFIVGVGSGDGLTRRLLSQTGGDEQVTLSISEMPKHRHQNPTRGDDQRQRDENRLQETIWALPVTDKGTMGGAHERPTEYVGNGQPHNNIPPYIALRYCKKL